MSTQEYAQNDSQVAGRRWRDTESGIALMSVLVMTLIITMLSVLVIGLVVAQTRPTLFSNKNARTISAAQAGIDSAIAQIRNATTVDGSGTTVGDIHQIPCVVNGTVETSVGNLSYAAKVSYYKEDPDGKDETWRTDNKLECFTGPSAYGLKAVPFYAIVTSVGEDASASVMSNVADRTLEAKYTFPLTTRTISGGQIMDANSQYCLVADSAKAGSLVRYQRAENNKCKDADDLNLWSWRSDYMIHLSSSDLDGRVPLCLSGRARNTTPVAMTLEACTLSAQDPLGQRFSWTGNHTWLGQNATNTAYGTSFVVNKDGEVNAGDEISVSTSASNPKPMPLPAVGKGNASSETDQVVNQSLFGRCLDVTDEQIDKSFLITYPCKQDPTGNEGFSWNHKWYFDEPDMDAGETSVTTTVSVKVGNASTNCLITTSTQGLVAGVMLSGTSAGDYKPNLFPRFRTTSNRPDCTSGNAQWTRYAETGDSKTSWTLVDANGKCLSADGPKIGSMLWYSVVVQECDGKDYQKWNVPDDPIQASVGSYEEKTGRDN